MNIADLRKEYTLKELDTTTVNPSPFNQFKEWFHEAVDADLLEPNAMVLSTVDQSLMPSSRTVLLKAYDDQGFVFYTNYTSNKARHIEDNNRVSVLFPWYVLERQLIIRGTVEKISSAESLKYFLSRPFGSKLGAWVSQQSSIITSRSLLEKKLEEMKEKFKDGKVPLPDHWGGLKISPVYFEFWQGRPNRLHDRIAYSLENGEWRIDRLSP